MLYTTEKLKLMTLMTFAGYRAYAKLNPVHAFTKCILAFAKQA